MSDAAPGPGSTVAAIVVAYKEAGVIGEVVADLISGKFGCTCSGDGPTEDTVAAVQPMVGRGVIHACQKFEGVAPALLRVASLPRRTPVARPAPGAGSCRAGSRQHG
jgi:hypothetical protein